MAIQGARLASSNYLSTAASTWFQPGRTLTAMCWARPDTIPPTSNYYTLMGTTTGAGISGWAISIQGGSSTAFWESFFTNNGSSYDDFRFTNSVSSGRWDHVAWVIRSDNTQAGYLNGVQETLVQSANAGTYPAAASRTLQIKWGDATGNGTFGGALAYVRIFDGELSGAEIRAEMFARRAANRRLHVICDFPLEAPGGTSSIVAPDYGPQGLHVTSVTGTVTWDRDPPLPLAPSAVLLQARRFNTTSGATPISLADAGSETEAVTVAATVPLADAAASTESVSVAAAVPLADAASSTQTLSVSAAVGLADTGAAADTLAVVVTLGLADAASALEQLGVTATVPLTQTASAADSLNVNTGAAGVPGRLTSGTAGGGFGSTTTAGTARTASSGGSMTTSTGGAV